MYIHVIKYNIHMRVWQSIANHWNQYEATIVILQSCCVKKTPKCVFSFSIRRVFPKSDKLQVINMLQHLQQTAIRVLKDEPLRWCEKTQKVAGRYLLVQDPEKNLVVSLSWTTSNWQPNYDRTPKTWEFMNKLTYDKYVPLGSMCMFLCDVFQKIYTVALLCFVVVSGEISAPPGWLWKGPRYDEHNAEGRVLKVIVHHLMPCKSWESNKSILLDREGSGFLGYGWFSEILAALKKNKRSVGRLHIYLLGGSPHLVSS